MPTPGRGKAPATSGVGVERGRQCANGPRVGRPAWKASRVGHHFFHGIPFSLIDPATNHGHCWLALSNQPGLLAQQVTIHLPEPRRRQSC